MGHTQFQEENIISLGSCPVSSINAKYIMLYWSDLWTLVMMSVLDFLHETAVSIHLVMVYLILNSDVVSLKCDSWKYKGVCTSRCRLSITEIFFSLVIKEM